MAIKSVSDLQYYVAPSTYKNLTLVPAQYVTGVLGIKNWESGETYTQGDVVFYNGNLYVAGDGTLGTPGAANSGWTEESQSIYSMAKNASSNINVSSGTGVTISNAGVASLNVTWGDGLEGPASGNTVTAKVKLTEKGGLSLDGTSPDKTLSVLVTGAIEKDTSTGALKVKNGDGSTTAGVVKLDSTAAGLSLSSGVLKVQAADKSITVGANNIKVNVYSAGGLKTDSTNGVMVKLDTTTDSTYLSGLSVGANGLKADYTVTSAAKKLLMLNASGKIDLSVLPDLQINNVFTATSTGTTGTGGMCSSLNSSYSTIKPKRGDVCLVTTGSGADTVVTPYILMSGVDNSTDYQTLANWREITTAKNTVTSFGGSTGDITITANTGLSFSSGVLSGTQAADATRGTVSLAVASKVISSGNITSTWTTNSGSDNTAATPKAVVTYVEKKLGDYQTTISTSGASSGQVLSYNGSGFAWVNQTAAYSLTPAGTSSSALGGVYVDNSTIGVEDDGKIKVIASYLTTNAASTTYQTKISTSGASSGQVLSYNGTGFSWVNQTTAYSLTAATTDALGGVIIPVEATSYLSNTSGTIKVAVKSNGGIAYDSTANATGLYVKIDNNTIVNTSGTLSVDALYTQRSWIAKVAEMTWSEDKKPYAKNAVVYYNGSLWVSNSNSNNTAPGTNQWWDYANKETILGTGLDYVSGLLTVSVDNSTITKTSSGSLQVGEISAAKITSGTLGRSRMSFASGYGTTTSNGGAIYLANDTSGLTVSSGALVVNFSSSISSDKASTKKATTPNAVVNYVLTDVHGYPAFSEDSSSAYSIGDLVVYDGTLYKCSGTGATGGTWVSSKWTATTVSAVSKFTGQLTVAAESGSTVTSVAVTHNLGTKDLVVQVYEVNSLSTETSRKPVLVDYEFTSVNAINLLFASPRTNASYYRIVILAAR